MGVCRKSNTVTYIAHKGALVIDPISELPYTAYTAKGNTPDNFTLEPTLKKFNSEFPEIASNVKAVLADGIYDTEECKKQTTEILPGAELYTSINPRNRGGRPIEGVSGIQKVDPYGRPICISGHAMILSGRDLNKEEFIWVCPCFHTRYADKTLSCSEANHAACCNKARQGRTYRTKREMTPQIKWENPQHARRFINRYNHRSE